MILNTGWANCVIKKTMHYSRLAERQGQKNVGKTERYCWIPCFTSLLNVRICCNAIKLLHAEKCIRINQSAFALLQLRLTSHTSKVWTTVQSSAYCKRKYITSSIHGRMQWNGMAPTTTHQKFFLMKANRELYFLLSQGACYKHGGSIWCLISSISSLRGFTKNAFNLSLPSATRDEIRYALLVCSTARAIRCNVIVECYDNTGKGWRKLGRSNILNAFSVKKKAWALPKHISIFKFDYYKQQGYGHKVHINPRRNASYH